MAEGGIALENQGIKPEKDSLQSKVVPVRQIEPVRVS